jgi:hypothetical protein
MFMFYYVIWCLLNVLKVGTNSYDCCYVYDWNKYFKIAIIVNMNYDCCYIWNNFKITW